MGPICRTWFLDRNRRVSSLPVLVIYRVYRFDIGYRKESTQRFSYPETDFRLIGSN